MKLLKVLIFLSLFLKVLADPDDNFSDFSESDDDDNNSNENSNNEENPGIPEHKFSWEFLTFSWYHEIIRIAGEHIDKVILPKQI